MRSLLITRARLRHQSALSLIRVCGLPVESRSVFELTSPLISRTFWAIKGCCGLRESLEQGNQHYSVRASGMQAASIPKIACDSFVLLPRSRCWYPETPLGLSLSLLYQILDQIPDLLPEFNSIFDKKCETEGEKWKWHKGRATNDFGRLYSACSGGILDTNLR
jgi:hypothetical protein